VGGAFVVCFVVVVYVGELERVVVCECVVVVYVYDAVEFVVERVGHVVLVEVGVERGRDAVECVGVVVERDVVEYVGHVECERVLYECDVVVVVSVECEYVVCVVVCGSAGDDVVDGYCVEYVVYGARPV